MMQIKMIEVNIIGQMTHAASIFEALSSSVPLLFDFAFIHATARIVHTQHNADLKDISVKRSRIKFFEEEACHISEVRGNASSAQNSIDWAECGVLDACKHKFEL